MEEKAKTSEKVIMSRKPMRITLTLDDLVKLKKYRRKQTKNYIVDLVDSDFSESLKLFGKPCKKK